MLVPGVALFFHSIPGANFQQDNARLLVSETVQDFCSVHPMQVLPWPDCSPDLSSIKHMCYLADRCLVRDPRPAASNDDLWLCVQAIWNSLPQADIQKLFGSMPRRIAALIAARSGCTKY